MNTLRFTSLLTLLIGATAGVLSANDTGGAQSGGPEGGRRYRRHSPIRAALDANQDRVIDASEIARAPAALRTLDKNGDGMLTVDELRPARPEGAETNGSAPSGTNPEAGQRGGKGGKHRRKHPLAAALDANHDRTIDANEIANASRALLQLDKNGDGQLSRDDMRRPHGEPQAGGEAGASSAPAN